MTYRRNKNSVCPNFEQAKRTILNFDYSSHRLRYQLHVSTLTKSECFVTVKQMLMAFSSIRGLVPLEMDVSS